MGFFNFFGKRGTTKKNDKVEDGLLREMLEEVQNNVGQYFEEISGADSDISAFNAVLEQEMKKHLENQMVPVPGEEEGNSLAAVDARPVFYVSADHMNAYVCVLPPLNEGDGLEQERFLEDMRYEGIIYGIDEGAVSQVVSRGDYLHIMQIARGVNPRDGKDGELEELFERRNEKTLEFPDNVLFTGMNLRKQNKVQTIHKGEIICRIHPPVEARDGVTVSGQVLRAREGKAVRIPQGKNTKIAEDGAVLLADSSGVVIMEGDNFAVNDQKIMANGVNAAVGDLECTGDLFIRGNVEDGVTVIATGNIIIEGDVRDGKIISGGTIRIQGEVKGSYDNELKADKQIQCAVLENGAAYARGNIYAEVIANSTVVSRGGSVYALSGRGLIFGGTIQACVSVFAKKIGNISGCVNTFTLGYNPKRADRRDAVANELKEINVLYDRLRKDVTDMRAAGKNYQRETKDEYTRLVEQRSMYDELASKKAKELEELDNMLLADVSGSITCESVYPLTKVRIGGRELTIEKEENSCNIQLRGKQIVLR